VEWERAARGADGRSFPGGDSLSGDDADIDETYGRDPLGFGPDPVGLHPKSTSPVGVADLAGNAWEMTVSPSGAPAIRGGSWYQGALTARSVNREPSEPTARSLLVGARLCATVH
jgi:formylglycine-generating enzyme required for sulfatase activity